MAGGGSGDMAEELQKGALAGTVLTDDTDDIALLDLERNVLQSPDIVTVALGRAVVDLANLEIGVFFAEDGGLPPTVEVVLQGAGADEAEAVLLADIFKNYSGIHILYFTGTSFERERQRQRQQERERLLNVNVNVNVNRVCGLKRVNGKVF